MAIGVARNAEAAGHAQGRLSGFLAFADFARIDVPEDLAHLKAWRARVASRPSIAQA